MKNDEFIPHETIDDSLFTDHKKFIEEKLKHDKNIVYKARTYNQLNKRIRKLIPILIKRKSAFTIYEWIKIKELLKINE